jgi:HEPN domain-containing protein
MANHINTSQEWRELAEDDLRSAEILANHLHPVPVGIVSFHCQQTAEKYLKAYLAAKIPKEPPYIHDLDELCKQCESIDADFQSISVACSVLTEFSVKGRYDRGLDVDESDMQTILNYAKSVKEFVNQHFQ